MARWGVLGLVAAVLCAAPASAGADADAARARAGLDAAVAAGRISALEADVYKRYATEAAAAAARLPGARGANLAGMLRTVAAQSGHYDLPRAVALFEALRFNTEYLGRSELPAVGADRRDEDGIVYRAVAGIGLQYHPLGTFGKLNADVTAGRYRPSVRLAYAMLARARPSGDALVWETYFGTSGGNPPWTSGMTQAVAAQALARTGFLPDARKAYRGVRGGLLQPLPQGPWVRLYHFNRDLVLNAQLQTALSVAEYGRLAGDPDATALAAELRRSALALLPRFDTGDWSLYALGGGEAELTYHGYVASLLWKLEAATGNEAWGRWALTFRRYWRTPPRIEAGPPWPAVIPVPADGHRELAAIRFWTSKPGTVTWRVAGETRSLWKPAGTHELWWAPGPRPPGEYDVDVSVVDKAGNRTDAKLAPVTVVRDNEAPNVEEAALAGGTLSWRARDAGTPWLDVRVVLRRAGALRERRLGQVGHAGEEELELPAEAWHATLVTRDSSGNRTAVPLGTINPYRPFAEH
jgi:hypothetical protein